MGKWWTFSLVINKRMWKRLNVIEPLAKLSCTVFQDDSLWILPVFSWYHEHAEEIIGIERDWSECNEKRNKNKGSKRMTSECIKQNDFHFSYFHHKKVVFRRLIDRRDVIFLPFPMCNETETAALLSLTHTQRQKTGRKMNKTGDMFALVDLCLCALRFSLRSMAVCEFCIFTVVQTSERERTYAIILLSLIVTCLSAANIKSICIMNLYECLNNFMLVDYYCFSFSFARFVLRFIFALRSLAHHLFFDAHFSHSIVFDNFLQSNAFALHFFVSSSEFSFVFDDDFISDILRHWNNTENRRNRK